MKNDPWRVEDDLLDEPSQDSRQLATLLQVVVFTTFRLECRSNEGALGRRGQNVEASVGAA